MAKDRELSLVEHLEELRDRLIKSAIALAITTLLSFAFAKQFLRILIAPMGDTPPVSASPTTSIVVFTKVALISGVALAMPRPRLSVDKLYGSRVDTAGEKDAFSPAWSDPLFRCGHSLRLFRYATHGYTIPKRLSKRPHQP